MLNINLVISTFYLYLNLRDVKDPYHVMKRYVKIMYAHLSTITYPARIYTYLLYSTVSTCKGQPFIHLLLSYLLDFISTRVVGFFTYLIRPKSPLSRALVRLRLGR